MRKATGDWNTRNNTVWKGKQLLRLQKNCPKRFFNYTVWSPMFVALCSISAANHGVESTGGTSNEFAKAVHLRNWYLLMDNLVFLSKKMGGRLFDDHPFFVVKSCSAVPTLFPSTCVIFLTCWLEKSCQRSLPTSSATVSTQFLQFIFILCFFRIIALSLSLAVTPTHWKMRDCTFSFTNTLSMISGVGVVHSLCPPYLLASALPFLPPIRP